VQNLLVKRKHYAYITRRHVKRLPPVNLYDIRNTVLCAFSKAKSRMIRKGDVARLAYSRIKFFLRLPNRQPAMKNNFKPIVKLIYCRNLSACPIDRNYGINGFLQSVLIDKLFVRSPTHFNFGHAKVFRFKASHHTLNGSYNALIAVVYHFTERHLIFSMKASIQKKYSVFIREQFSKFIVFAIKRKQIKILIQCVVNVIAFSA